MIDGMDKETHMHKWLIYIISRIKMNILQVFCEVKLYEEGRGRP